jgi:hypothetical protein
MEWPCNAHAHAHAHEHYNASNYRPHKQVPTPTYPGNRVALPSMGGTLRRASENHLNGDRWRQPREPTEEKQLKPSPSTGLMPEEVKKKRTGGLQSADGAASGPGGGGERAQLRFPFRQGPLDGKPRRGEKYM